MKASFDTFAQLYRTHINDLYSYGIGLGYDESVCMDAIHDVFCRLVVSGKGLDNVANVKFYLLRSVKNRLLDIRKHGRKVDYEDMGVRGFRAEVTLADETLVEREERDRLTARVKGLMDELTDTQREAIYLRYIQEMEYEEIASLLGITPESVRKLVYRGLEKLRRSNIGPMGFFVFLSLLRFYQYSR